MEEIEVPTEHLQEQIHHSAEHSRERWISQVALSSAILAVFAAASALLSGHHANEAMIEQILASDRWAFYQAKGIKAAVLKSKTEILEAVGRTKVDSDSEKLKQYADDQEKISEQAKEKEAGARHHLANHMIFARSVTFFQIAIAIAAVAALVRQRRFWWVALGFGSCGLAFLIQGVIFMYSA